MGGSLDRGNRIQLVVCTRDCKNRSRILEGKEAMLYIKRVVLS